MSFVTIAILNLKRRGESRLDFFKVEILFQDQVGRTVRLCTMVLDGGVTHSLFGKTNEKGEEGKSQKCKAVKFQF
jgi:hypothetical protein